MPLDVLGRTRATLAGAARGRRERAAESGKPGRAGDRPFAIVVLNEEFLVGAVISQRRLCPCPLYTPPVATTD